jgi:hypothetical protein
MKVSNLTVTKRLQFEGLLEGAKLAIPKILLIEDNP